MPAGRLGYTREDAQLRSQIHQSGKLFLSWERAMGKASNVTLEQVPTWKRAATEWGLPPSRQLDWRELLSFLSF